MTTKEKIYKLIEEIDNDQALEDLWVLVRMIYNQFKLGRWDA